MFDYLTAFITGGSTIILIGSPIVLKATLIAADLSSRELCSYEIGKYDARPGKILYTPIVKIFTASDQPSLPRWETPVLITHDGNGLDTAFYCSVKNFSATDDVYVTLYWNEG